jgi:hypothetical protein
MKTVSIAKAALRGGAAILLDSLLAAAPAAQARTGGGIANGGTVRASSRAYGSSSISTRSLKVPRSDSSALQTT